MKFRLFTGIRIGNIYACTAGDYVGQMFMCIDKNKTCYGFLSMPSMENTWILKDVVDSGLKNGILDYVERPPRNVRDICKVQFEENRKEL